MSELGTAGEKQCVKLWNPICTSSRWSWEVDLAMVFSLEEEEIVTSLLRTKRCTEVAVPASGMWTFLRNCGISAGSVGDWWTVLVVRGMQEWRKCHLCFKCYKVCWLSMLYQIDGTFCSHFGLWKLSWDAFVFCGLFPVSSNPPSRLLTESSISKSLKSFDSLYWLLDKVRSLIWPTRSFWPDFFCLLF